MQNKQLNYTDKGYSYVKCSNTDCFNWGGLGICDSCGRYIEDEVYLIFILNSAYCKKCFKEWENRSKRYKEDIQLQKESQERWYMYHGFKTI